MASMSALTGSKLGKGTKITT